MTALAQGEESKWQVYRHRYTFKFRMRWSRHGNFLIDDFNLVGLKGKMRIVEVTGGEHASLHPGDLPHLFYGFAMYKHFTLLCDGIFCQAALCFKIETYGITIKFILSLFEVGIFYYNTHAVFTVNCRQYLGLLI